MCSVALRAQALNKAYALMHGSGTFRWTCQAFAFLPCNEWSQSVSHYAMLMFPLFSAALYRVLSWEQGIKKASKGASKQCENFGSVAKSSVWDVVYIACCFMRNQRQWWLSGLMLWVTSWGFESHHHQAVTIGPLVKVWLVQPYNDVVRRSRWFYTLRFYTL